MSATNDPTMNYVLGRLDSVEQIMAQLFQAHAEVAAMINALIDDRFEHADDDTRRAFVKRAQQAKNEMWTMMQETFRDVERSASNASSATGNVDGDVTPT